MSNAPIGRITVISSNPEINLLVQQLNQIIAALVALIEAQ